MMKDSLKPRSIYSVTQLIAATSLAHICVLITTWKRAAKVQRGVICYQRTIFMSKHRSDTDLN